MQALYLGIAVVALYGCFVGIKSLIKLWRLGEAGKKMFLSYLIFFVVAPCIFSGGYYIIDESNPNIWIVAPLLLLAFMWIISGYFVQSAYQRLASNQVTTRPKEKAKSSILIGISMFFVGFVIWLVGFFNGYAKWDNFLLVLSVFLLVRGGYMVLTNLKYLKEKPKPQKAKTNKPQKTNHSKQPVQYKKNKK